MLIDVALLPQKKMADDGDPDALIELVDAYYLGKGVPKDFSLAKKYLIKLSHFHPDDLPQLGYGTLLFFIGDACQRLGQMEEANAWYHKSIDYFSEIYNDAFANKLIRDYQLDSLIKETSQYIG